MDLAEELVAMDASELANEACILVDWRDEEEAIIEAFAEKLPDEDLEPFWRGDDLGFRHDGAEYLLPLTISPADRYVAIGSLASVLADRYQARLYIPSLETDTHSLLVLPHAVWRALEERYAGWTRENFQALQLGRDYFGGGEVPYIRTA